MPYKDIEKRTEYRKKYEISERCKTRREKYYQKNKEVIIEKRKKYYLENPKARERLLNQKKKYAQDHKEERSKYQKEYRQKNKEKLDKNHKEYYRNNREILLKNSRDRNLNSEVIKRNRELKLIKSFGISNYQYEELLLKQKGLCGMCSKPESSKHQSGTLRKLAVDHDHETGRIRGLLCSRCNNGIGLLGDKVEMLKKAINYLK